jgi:hypothetical protein
MLKGGCFCSFVRYVADATPFHEANCHCSVCRRTSGAPYVTWFSVPLRAFRWTSGEPSSFASSNHGTRTFCPRCGTPLTFSSRHFSEEIDITVASLDEPSEVPPKADIHVGTKLPWVVLDRALPSHASDREGE